MDLSLRASLLCVLSKTHCCCLVGGQIEIIIGTKLSLVDSPYPANMDSLSLAVLAVSLLMLAAWVVIVPVRQAHGAQSHQTSHLN